MAQNKKGRNSNKHRGKFKKRKVGRKREEKTSTECGNSSTVIILKKPLKRKCTDDSITCVSIFFFFLKEIHVGLLFQVGRKNAH